MTWKVYSHQKRMGEATDKTVFFLNLNATSVAVGCLGAAEVQQVIPEGSSVARECVRELIRLTLYMG